MKKLLILGFLLLLAGCARDNDLEIRIMVPGGATAIAHIHVQGSEVYLGANVSYSVDVRQGRDPLVAAFTSQTHDIVIAPFDLGAQLYNLGSFNYQLAAIVTFGNLFLATVMEEEFTLESLEGRDIILFGQNSVPDIVVRTALEGITPNQIRYVNAAGDAQAELVLDNSNIVLLAEPSLSVAQRLVPGLQTIDLQEAFYQKTGHNYPQAGVFISNNLIDNHPEVVRKYLEAVRNSTVEVNKNPAEAARLAVELEFGFPEAVLVTAIPRSNIGFQTPQESMEDIVFLLNRILALNPALLSGRLPSEALYHVQK
ncbi:MAG: ABC transporter substrate-binding protein [Erysipelotrichales bacterium]|nr:ABC transporter substrate-binding protein [Erysipelotrichales bacterium]